MNVILVSLLICIYIERERELFVWPWASPETEEKAARPSVIWDLHRYAKTSVRGTPQNVSMATFQPRRGSLRRYSGYPAAAEAVQLQQAFRSRRGEGFGVARRAHAAFDEGSLAGYCLVVHLCSSRKNEQRMFLWQPSLELE